MSSWFILLLFLSEVKPLRQKPCSVYLIILQGVGYLKLWENTSERDEKKTQGNSMGLKQILNIFQGNRRLSIWSVQLSSEMDVSLVCCYSAASFELINA